MEIFTLRQRKIVYGTNIAVIGTAVLAGVAIDVWILEHEKYPAAAFAAIVSLPLALWLTVRRIRQSIQPPQGPTPA